MFKYFSDKLTKLTNDIDRNTKYLIEYATSGTIKQIQDCAKMIVDHKEMQNMFAKDAVEQLDVDQVITLINAGLIINNQAVYVYRYSKSVTLAERDRLVKLDYSYKDIKVK